METPALAVLQAGYAFDGLHLAALEMAGCRTLILGAAKIRCKSFRLDSGCPTPSRKVAGYETEKHHPATLSQPGRPPVRRRQIDSAAQRPARACRRHRRRPRQRL